jgi:hypothetical protein
MQRSLATSLRSHHRYTLGASGRERPQVFLAGSATQGDDWIVLEQQ